MSIALLQSRSEIGRVGSSGAGVPASSVRMLSVAEVML
jgi:hypothetical protein